MIKKEDLTKKIGQLMAEAGKLDKYTQKRLLTSIKNELKVQKNCLLYLETEPTEDFVKKQLAETVKRKKIVIDGFFAWTKSITDHNGATESKLKSRYNTLFGLKKLTEQVKYLKIILNN